MLYDNLASKKCFTKLTILVTLKLKIITGPQFTFYLTDQPIKLKQNSR